MTQPTPTADPSPADDAPPPTAGEAPHGVASSALILGAIGIVFGDIGTSPLYTLQECLNDHHGVPPNLDNVFGVVSLIVWSVTMVVTVKYLAFLMRADNEGEGGIMALLALVPRKISGAPVGRVGFIATLVVVGAALLFGDGIITPAISVLAAMEGLEVATVTLKPFIVPLTVVILVGLFVIQRRGTGKIGALFGPVMVVWFVTIGALGLQHILRRPEILGALWPGHGVRFFAQNGFRGFRVLGGVVLSVTGGEALYADMGHFGRRPIRAAWLGLIYPALLLCYLGEGAAILDNPAGAAQPFYALIPRGPWIYPAVVLASAATVIASQALISGVFSLTHQAMRLGYFPRLLVKHTSGEAEGQIYLPLINWGLAVACIALVLIFRESSKLAAAFGLAVSGTMAITSIVYYVVTRETWGWPKSRALAVLLLFLSFDIPFLLANCLKFMDGGYIPFLVGVGFVVAMISWRIGRSYLADVIRAESPPVDAFIAEVDRDVRARIPGTAVIMTATCTGVPPVLHRLVDRFKVIHEHVVLVTVATAHVPTVPEANRSDVERIGPGIDRVILHYGFMEVPRVPEALAVALPRLGITVDPGSLIYILGHETMIVTEKGRMGRITEPVFALLSRNVRSITDDLGLPITQVVELGMQVDL
jgi:KUP system potassium uptake protein